MSLRDVRWMRVDGSKDSERDRSRERISTPTVWCNCFKRSFWKDSMDNPKLKVWAQKYYLADWLVLVFILLCVLTFVNLNPPFQRVVPKEDPSLSYPVKSSSVPIWMLIVFSNLLPLSVFVFYWISITSSPNGHIVADVDLLHSSIGLLQSTIFSVFLTTFLKVLAGRPRPNFMALCEFDDGSCQAQAAMANDARKSYPSGHASYAFAGLFFLTLYLLGKMRVAKFETKKTQTDSPPAVQTDSLASILINSSTWRVCLATLPALLACWIAVSRTRDYWHSFSDINAGSALGCVCAYFAYRMHFPSMFNRSQSHRPLAVLTPLSASSLRRGSFSSIYDSVV